MPSKRMMPARAGVKVVTTSRAPGFMARAISRRASTVSGNRWRAPPHRARAPEVGWNGAVLHRELAGLGFTGTYQQVQRFLKPYRAQRKWSELATARFETEPGEQAQVDYGQLQVWIGEQPQTVHLFVFTLGYSRRLFTRGYRNERLATLLDGHERALRRNAEALFPRLRSTAR